MSVADKLLQVNQVKQDIKTAIETKGVPMTDVAFTEYANKILDISGGGGEVDEYFYYSKAYYTITNNATLFSNAWQDMEDAETTLYDIPLTLAGTEQNGDITMYLYVGADGTLEQLYNDLVNEVIPLQQDVYLANNYATSLSGDMSSGMFSFGGFALMNMPPFGIVLINGTGTPIPNDTFIIQQGFEFENENGIILPNSVTSIGSYAFYQWTSNNHPLVIPNSVTSIGDDAFPYWTSNNQSLVIPNSVTSIGSYAFYQWTSNNQPLVIPNSVTSIGENAFSNWSLVPYVEIQAITPPTLANANAFNNQNNAPIYVPDASVTAYKTATNWADLASRIFSINDK